jgi:hypothetical protein
VVKAMSWALPELARRDPPAVHAFMAGGGRGLAPRVMREVGSKLRTGLKNPRKKQDAAAALTASAAAASHLHLALARRSKPAQERLPQVGQVSLRGAKRQSNLE